MAYIVHMKRPPITVIETPSFIRDARNVMDDTERQQLISFLAFNPTAGDILEGTGGIRKVRWAREGGGKSGGFRVVYFFHNMDIPLFALNIFAKNEKANVSKAERNELKKMSTLLVDAYKGGKP